MTNRHRWLTLGLAVLAATSAREGSAGGEACRKAAALALRFEPAENSPIIVGQTPGRPVSGDVNGDGHVDLVVACGACRGESDPSTGNVVVLLGDGRGRFTWAEGSPFEVGASVRKLALGDFDEDGKLDVAAVEHDFARVTVLLGDGKGGLRTAPHSPFVTAQSGRPHTHDVAISDVNGDRHADLLTTNVFDDSVSVLLGDGRGEFAPAEGSPVKVGRGPYDAIVVRDLDGDGRVDFATPNIFGGRIDVLAGDGHGGFARVRGAPFQVAERPGYLISADVDGDRRPDLLATHDDVGMLDVLINKGSGAGGGAAFEPAPGSPIALGEPTWGIDAADFDGDGHVDVVAAALKGRSPRILLGDGKGGFAEAAGIELHAGNCPDHVIAADLDDDGRSDLIVSNYESGDLSIFLARSARR